MRFAQEYVRIRERTHNERNAEDMRFAQAQICLGVRIRERIHNEQERI